MENLPEIEQPESEGTSGADYNRDSILAFFWETVKFVLIALVIIVPIRYYLIQPFFVKGPSMESTFLNGDYVLIDEISYRFHPPKRGDVVIFRPPTDQSEFYIKRAIGLPGETIQIKNSQVIIYNQQYPQGFRLDESTYLDRGQTTTGDLRIKVDDNEYFVLGDNRLHSSDSRYWGAVNRSLITGRVFLRALPLSNFSTFSGITS